ncbi:MAG: ABC transporter permease [Moraxellaceae bacterium]|nr:ABC transporter permease [Moraxellaceae bacterium]
MSQYESVFAASNRVALTTIVVKEIRRFTRIWVQTLLPPAITMTLYFVIFGNLVGRSITDMGGFTYMQFIVPGLIMMAVITNSYANVVSSFFGAKFQRSIEEMLVAPVPHATILAGFVLGGVARGLLVAVIVTLVSLFFTQLSLHNVFVMVYSVLITAILFSLGGFINAVFAKTFDDVSLVPTFILTPLTYLGGVFYSMDVLSPFWQNLSLLNPIVYMVNAFRYGVLGHSDVNVFVSLVVMTVFTVAAYAVAYTLLKRGTGMRE